MTGYLRRCHPYGAWYGVRVYFYEDVTPAGLGFVCMVTYKDVPSPGLGLISLVTKEDVTPTGLGMG